jgi:hypothetical protein
MPKMLCTKCLTIAPPKKMTPGSGLIELLLWCFMIFPGIIYSIWRITSKKLICNSCKSTELIPEDSPGAKRLLSSNPSTPSIS